MVDLDELGARVRTQTSAPAPSVGEIAARAVRRRQRRLATRLGSVAAVVVVLVGVVWAVGSREEPTSVITVPQSPRSLGAGRVVWPDESLSYADVEGLAAGFRDEFLGEGWTFTVSEVNEVEVYVSFTGPNGEYLLGSAEAFELGVAFTSVNTDRSLVLGADGTVSVEDREGGLPASVDIFHRPHGSHSTLSTSDQPVTGPWVLPGADEVGEVGTVLVIERGETGEVLAVRGSAIDGVGTTVNFGDLGVSVPAAEAQSIFGPAVDSDGWVNVRQVPVDERFDALAAQSADQRVVCLALRYPESDGTAVTCSLTWRFLQRGITLAFGFQDGAAVSMVFLPVSVTDDQVAEVGHTVANGQILVLEPAPPNRLEIQTPDRLLVLRLGP